MVGQRERQMVLVAFMQASNCSNYPASWRHPGTMQHFLTPDYYQDIARTLEAGLFHLAFFDDRLAMPSQYGASFAEAVQHGIRAVKLDLVPVMTAMLLATQHLGVGATYSTTYYAPFHIARLFATLDHLSRGRAAWNIVTSLNDAEARNFGRPRHADHDARYDQADEFVEVVTGLWRTWEEGALLLDRQQQQFADPRKVHRLDYQGQWFQAQGPLTVPRPPQGRPVLIQAGQSQRGREFAARWGELIFVITPTLISAQTLYGDVKARAQRYGRAPETLKIAPALYIVVGETPRIAREKLAYVESLARPADALVLLSEVMNYDFARHDLDEPLPQAALEQMTGIRSMVERVIQNSGKANPSVRDFLHATGRGTLHELPCFVGTPGQVADQMATWFQGQACDGFVVAATHLPGAYEDAVRLVVPELQQRGLFHTSYTGSTLRENLSLPWPL
ncbi:MAG: LLM class flavin-dependent oxidoreductase [Candidatus Tectimicrobiota bacterium]